MNKNVPLDWMTFFKLYGECPTTNGIPSATLEQIYQAFKERFKAEVMVTPYHDDDPSSGYGRLEDL